MVPRRAGGRLCGSPPAEAVAGWSERYPEVTVRPRLVAAASPAGVLVEESGAAQLTVVGAHGRGSLGGLLLGSVSHAVLHHCRSPLAVVRHPGADVAAPGAGQPGPSAANATGGPPPDRAGRGGARSRNG